MNYRIAYRNRTNDLSYYVSGQVSATKYMRTDWLETPANNSYDKWRNRTANRYQNIWWGNESGGMFTSLDEARNFIAPTGQGTLPGDWWLTDWNGDGIINDKDDHPIASYGLPVFNYGISIGASWKNFDLALDFQGAYGVYVQYAEVLDGSIAVRWTKYIVILYGSLASGRSQRRLFQSQYQMDLRLFPGNWS